jgi:hypothetical protein
MRMKLELMKAGKAVLAGEFEVSDAESFGHACTELWMQLEKRGFDKTTSVGEFMERAGESVARELVGSALTFREG